MKKVYYLILPLVILLAAIAVVATMLKLKTPPEKKPLDFQPPLVEVKNIDWREWPMTLTSQGFVQPQDSAVISAQISGQVEALHSRFKVGGIVKMDEELLTLDDADYIAQLESAKANLSSAEAALSEEKAKAEVAEAEWKNIQQPATALALRKPQVASAKANLAFAQAQLDNAQLQLIRTQILSPYNAIVVSRDAQKGEYLTAGKQVAELYSIDTAEVRVAVTPAQLNRILGGASRVEFSPIPIRLFSVTESNLSWSAELVRSEKVITRESQVIYLIAQIKDPYNLQGGHAAALYFGQYLMAEIPLAKLGKTARIPRSLLTPRETLIVENNSRLFIRSVSLAYKDKNYVYVESGLQPEDRLITSALSNPINGLELRVQHKELSEAKQ